MIDLSIWTAPIYAALILSIFGLRSPVFWRLHAAMGVISLFIISAMTYIFTPYQFGMDSLLVGCFFDSLFGAALSVTLIKFEKHKFTGIDNNKNIRLYIYYIILMVSFLSTALISLYAWNMNNSGTYIGSDLNRMINPTILTFNIINALCLIEGGYNGLSNTIRGIRDTILLSYTSRNLAGIDRDKAPKEEK